MIEIVVTTIVSSTIVAIYNSQYPLLHIFLMNYPPTPSSQNQSSATLPIRPGLSRQPGPWDVACFLGQANPEISVVY